uniref:Uncharacterized protein n=1 Tax=Streptomyces sp. F12 TaxID=1436084 RepID=V9Z7X0_9ACTN|nr:hypothetical protein [Streptomyces sp. F12]AHE40213.1 hypothetical protein pFRL6_126 [Streptomyces sp. F12]
MTITLHFEPQDRVQRPTIHGKQHGTVRTTSWESTSGMGCYYIQWDGSSIARPYSDTDVADQQITLTETTGDV